MGDIITLTGDTDLEEVGWHGNMGFSYNLISNVKFPIALQPETQTYLKMASLPPTQTTQDVVYLGR